MAILDSNSLPQVELQSVTPDPEVLMAYVARVSNPANQSNPKISKLLRYCIQNGHWSVFEHSHMTLKITTNLAIATQILRHRSFTFAQLSRRYAGEEECPVNIQLPQLRAPHPKNRQESLDTLAPAVSEWFGEKLQEHFVQAETLYKDMLSHGVAKECARAILPQASETTLFMTGNCRSWVHYICLRAANGTQIEHRQVAVQVQNIFRELYPNVSQALDELQWNLQPTPTNTPQVSL
jgi:thymidylate synthase (FAD)